MKAYVLHGINDLRLEDVEVPVLKEQEVLVKVQVAGICGSDIPRIYKTGAHVQPLIPGHEFSGIVVEVGKNADRKWLQKRVGIFPLVPCKKCRSCQKKQYEMCQNYGYLGSRQNGGFAEYVAVPESNLILLPDMVSFEEAAMLEPMAVAVHAMRQAGIFEKLQHRIVVCGLGTIGLLLVKFLKEAGAKNIFVIGNKDFQEKCILHMGIEKEYYCDSRRKDVGEWLLQKTHGEGADIFFECVGKNETVQQGIDFAAPTGMVILVGNPYTDMSLSKQTYWKILRNQLTVKGTWNSSFTGQEEDDWHYVLEKLEKRHILPAELISHRFFLKELDKGFSIMKNKSQDYIKIMGITED